MAIFLFSLAGLPPLAGFVGKFYLFAAVIERHFYLLALVGVLNSVVSLYYYARIVKAMFLDQPVGGEGVVAVGLQDGFLMGSLAGATLILKARFEVEDLLQTIQKRRPTLFPGVPQMYIAIQDYPGVRKYGISSIKACISGAAPLPVEVKRTFESITGGKLCEGYGLSETTGMATFNTRDRERKPGSIGVPVGGTEVLEPIAALGRTLLGLHHNWRPAGGTVRSVEWDADTPNVPVPWARRRRRPARWPW